MLAQQIELATYTFQKKLLFKEMEILISGR